MSGVDVLSPVQGRVQSSRDDNVWYAVSFDGKPFCTCKGFQYRGRCRHLTEFAEAVGNTEQLSLIQDDKADKRPPLPSVVPRTGFAIYTSRYQSKDKVIASGCVPVGVTVGNPRFSLPYRYHRAKELSPAGLLDIKDEKEFARKYVERLDRIGVEAIRSRLMELGGGGPVVLLCFEDTSREFCHRTVFAKWWKAKTGQDVQEL